MANENSKDLIDQKKTPDAQIIPLTKIHDLPGVVITKQPDKSYGGLVSSIQANGVTEPVILRQREDGEYQLLAGYRRRRACELAKVAELPALVYEMTLQQATEYHRKQKLQTNLPVPGKLVASQTELPQTEDIQAPAEATKKNDVKTKDPETVKKEVPPKEKVPSKVPGKEKKAVAEEKPKEEKHPVEPVKAAAAPTGPAAIGPSGTAITQVFEDRLNPPDEKALLDLPAPKAGESFFITLHPGYLGKSKFNNFSVEKDSENFKELRKSVELVGIKDPVLARLKPEGGLEILSGQRRHLAALELNYPVPTIIQEIDDDDAKIIVADGNLHRDKITIYDLSRALKMKMEGMKRKAGRRKKSDPAVPKLDTDEALAKEMGMTVSKLNRIIRLSEASKEVCDRVDDGSLALSIASAISFLKPKNQDEVMHLMDLGYKVSNERIERMKRVEKSGKLDETMMRDILDDKDIAPKPAPKPAIVVPMSDPIHEVQPSQVDKTPIELAPAPTVQQHAVPPAPSPHQKPVQPVPPAPVATEQPAVKTTDPEKKEERQEADSGKQERPEFTKVILTGDRLRKYYPDVSMTPREIEEDIYSKLEFFRQRDERAKNKPQLAPGR